MSLSFNKESKTLCIVMGFEYINEYKIPGILVDMFRVYSFAKDASMKVILITDIERDKSPQELTKSIRVGHSDPSIFSFLETAKENGEYYFWHSIEYVKHLLSMQCKDVERLFFYYTGHAVVKEIIFPSMEKVLTNDFTNWIYASLAKENQIVFFLDCCNTSYLDLPFVMTMDFSVSRYRSTAVKKGGIYHLLTQNPSFFKNEIICICSAMEDEDSSATWSGSTFTQLFFQQLEDSPNERNIHKLLVKVQSILKGKQACRAYASFPSLLCLPPWLFNNKLKNISHTKNSITISLLD